jgi:hypothetical protein
MNGTQIRCCRCKGRKNLYKMNNGYTHINMGAPLVDCPMCLGTGVMKPFEYAKEEIKEEAEKIREKRKSVKDDEKINEES